MLVTLLKKTLTQKGWTAFFLEQYFFKLVTDLGCCLFLKLSAKLSESLNSSSTVLENFKLYIIHIFNDI